MSQSAINNAPVMRLDLLGWLGLVIGVVMPVLSALLYPVYMHQMQPAWAEWTRLMELPFVACELAIIHVALRRGYRDGQIWTMLPRDVRVALGLLFLGLTVSSLFASKNVPVSVLLSLTTLIHLRFGAAVWFLVRREQIARGHYGAGFTGSLGAFFPLLGVGLMALTIMTIWKFQLPPPEWTVPGGKIEWPSALPGFINVRHFGSWTGAIAAGLMLALLYGRPEDMPATSLVYLLAAGLTCWSGTRAAVLAMGVVALIGLSSQRRLPSPSALVRVGGLSALSLIGAVALSPGLPEFALFMRENLSSANALTSGRLELWHDTFVRWLDAPMFGWGSGSTFWEVNIGWAHTQPHNAILQFLISWGMIGAAAGLWLISRAIVATHHIGMTDARFLSLTGTLYSLLFMSLLEGMLFYPRFIMLVTIGFAVLFAARTHDGANPGYDIRMP
jgi:exopolysaccharide production protein ExoQ